MNKSKNLIALALIAGLTGGLTACGGSSTNTDPLAEPVAEDPVVDPPIVDDPGTFPESKAVGASCTADCAGEAIGITCAADETPICDCAATPRTECDNSEAQ